MKERLMAFVMELTNRQSMPLFLPQSIRLLDLADSEFAIHGLHATRHYCSSWKMGIRKGVEYLGDCPGTLVPVDLMRLCPDGH